MAYNKNYLFTHNVDWYACINGVWIHAASRGGRLPEIVDDESALPRLQGICSNLPDIVPKEDVVVNEELIELRYRRAIEIYRRRVGDNEFREFLEGYTPQDFSDRFSALFVEYARKGFYSFVRLDIDDPDSNKYELVAHPRSGTPACLPEVIGAPFNSAFVDEAYRDYIARISVRGESLAASLDFLF